MEIKIEINGRGILAEREETVLETAARHGIRIPHLCHLKVDGIYANECATCRICVVEVDGREGLYPSCATKVWEGMRVVTNSPEIQNIRRGILELILSSHPKDCLICPKAGKCELQNLAVELRVNEVRYSSSLRGIEKDETAAIERNLNKCIMCRRCETMCNSYQTCNVLSGTKRGIDAVVTTSYGRSLEESFCTFCGQCVAVCPTGALTERDYSWDLIGELSNPEKIVVAQVAPAVRVALGEEFGYPPGTNLEKKISAALHELGFKYIFDTTWGADLTIMEEATELKERLLKYFEGDRDVKLPLLTSCCPAWINFMGHHFPNLSQIPSTAKSPQQMFSAVAKNIWTEEMGIPREKLVVVSIMPCLAKKQEAHSGDDSLNGLYDTDISISTRELAKILKGSSIDFNTLEERELDNPMGEYTGAGIIFGRTGGVIEAALRSAYRFMTGEELENLELIEHESFQDVKSAEITIGDRRVKIGIAHGLGAARKLLEKVESGEEMFHGIEIMACKGGCVGGGGQPYNHGDFNIIKARAKGLNSIDSGSHLRKSHENPYIKALYEKYLQFPGSESAKKLLHREICSCTWEKK